MRRRLSSHTCTLKNILSANNSKTALKAAESVKSSLGRGRSKRLFKSCLGVSARSGSSHQVGLQQIRLTARISPQLLAQRLQGQEHVAVRRAPWARVPPRSDREHVNTHPAGVEADARAIVNQGVTPVKATAVVLTTTVPGTSLPQRSAPPLVTGSNPVKERDGPAADQSLKLADFAEDLVLSVTRCAEGEHLELQSRKLGLTWMFSGLAMYLAWLS
jgi:hypothetical protein